ncbi:MAG: hypothetical protein J5J06_05025 [Phycisphaerae bacterium]|nr:hypothetical protein [Phycisphaerae bacterium]
MLQGSIGSVFEFRDSVRRAWLIILATTWLAPIPLGCSRSDRKTPAAEVTARPDDAPINGAPGSRSEPPSPSGRALPDVQPRLGEPLSGISPDQRARFSKGRALFNRSFRPEEGLGPTYNLFGCGACHSNPVGGSGTLTVTLFGRAEGDAFDPLLELGGPILQAEHEDADCVERVPEEANVVARHLTTPILGGGLVEAIPDAAIEAQSKDSSSDVSGRVNRSRPYEDGPDSAARVGRFGWKCQFATLTSFSAHAALNEVGITNRYFPAESPPNGQASNLAGCDPAPDPEDRPDDEGLEMLDRWVDFLRFLAPPPQTPRSGLPGEAVLHRIGCTECHVPSFTTSQDPSLPLALRGRTIHPYSDFLVHDMGASADGIAMGSAGRFEMRTSPLWGFRIRFPNWHDGRITAATLRARFEQSVELHDGEGASARDRFRALPPSDREALIRFIDSLGRVEFDFDGDNDVDLADYPVLFNCFTGESPGSLAPEDRCAIGDIDQDGDIDLVDTALMQRAFSGSQRGSAMVVP